MRKKKEQQDEIYREESLNTRGVTDWVKKTLLTGVGAVFMTEEGIRSAVKELNLPKNVVSSAITQADKTKRDLIGLVAKEVRQFLDGIEVDEILKKALSGQTIELSASIKFKNDNKPKKKAAKKAAPKKR